IGPKELPGVLRAVGQWTTKIRRMASEFQDQFREAMREAEMADLKKDIDEATGKLNASFDPLGDLKDSTEWKPAETPPAPATAPPAPRGGGAPSAARGGGRRGAGQHDAAGRTHAAAARPRARRHREGFCPAAARRTEPDGMSDEDEDKEIEATKAPLIEHLI